MLRRSRATVNAVTNAPITRVTNAPPSARSEVADPTRRRRTIMGAGVIGTAFLVDLLMQSVIAGPRQSRDRVIWFCVEFVGVIVACWATNAWSERRGYPPLGRLVRAVLVASTVGAALGGLAWLATHNAIPAPGRHSPPLQAVMGFGFVRGLFVCGLWALGFVYPLAVEAEQLRVSAELARLRSHLEPHFLLNTLNMIAGLVVDEPAEARRLIGCLGELLRDAMDDAKTRTQSLQDEIAWLQRYADILEARHRGSIAFHWKIAPEARALQVPRFLLQPLVENAAQHGALKKRGGGEVIVRATVEGAANERTLVCSVEDDGPGMGDAPIRKGAFGLHAVRRRVELECPGGSFRTEPATEDGRGTRMVLELPIVREEATP